MGRGKTPRLDMPLHILGRLHIMQARAADYPEKENWGCVGVGAVEGMLDELVQRRGKLKAYLHQVKAPTMLETWAG